MVRPSLVTVSPLAFVSGGSSGIGLACAARLLERGYKVVLAARGVERLASAKLELERRGGSGRVFTVSLDVADADACAVAVASVERDIGPIDMMITSAGIAVPGLFIDQPIEVHHRHLMINYMGTLALIHSVVPAMKSRGGGRLVLVSSGAGLVGVYGYGAYAPSKFAVRGLAETLSAELREHGIVVSLAYPPDTDTPQYATEQATKPQVTKAITAGAGLYDAAVVAKDIVDGALRGRFAITTGPVLFGLRHLHSLVGTLFLSMQRWHANHRITKSRS
jgi:3-dehydrosphinganine reductase